MAVLDSWSLEVKYILSLNGSNDILSVDSMCRIILYYDVCTNNVVALFGA